MNKRLCTLLFSSLMLAGAQARIWTSTTGKTVDAEVVRVNPDKTVVLKTTSGKVVTVPFNAFVESDVEHLETRLALPFDLHPFSWQEMNTLFGIDIWKDPLLWDDPTSETAERMALKKESKTAFMENHRAYPLGKQSLLNEPVYTTVLYGNEKCVDSL